MSDHNDTTPAPDAEAPEKDRRSPTAAQLAAAVEAAYILEAVSK